MTEPADQSDAEGVPEWMAQSAVVRDYRVLEIGWRRADRLQVIVAR